MTETYENINKNIDFICRGCIRSGDDLYPMTLEEINVYKTLVQKIHKADLDMYICRVCRWLLKKVNNFVIQCQRANNLLEMIYKDTKPPVQYFTNTHNFTTTTTLLCYFGPDSDDDKITQDDDIKINQDNDDYIDDDELPLVLLSSNREKKKSYAEKEKDIEIKVELDIKQETGTQDVKRKCKKEKNVSKEGFTSRMVRETDEYTVIKLTKEQVLKEMQEKLKSEEYTRAPYKCEHCSKWFNFEDVLENHMKKHSEEHGKFYCDICTQYCPSAVSLRGHMKSHTTRYKCKLCGYTRPCRQHLLEHHVNCHAPHSLIYTCQHCAYTSNKRTMIQRHMRTHRPAEKHACHKCGKLFKTIETLRVHTLRHDKSKCLRCKHCNRQFVYHSLLQQHIQNVHIREDLYCVECDIRFRSAENMNVHFRTAKRHRDPSSFKYPCKECDQRFISSTALSVHCSTNHGAPKQSCTYCGRSYSSTDSLRAHIRRAHTQKIQWKSQLLVQMRPHADETEATFTEHLQDQLPNVQKQENAIDVKKPPNED